MNAKSPTKENREDIFLWDDGFWCFRAEFGHEIVRDEPRCIIFQHTFEWLGFLLKSSNKKECVKRKTMH